MESTRSEKNLTRGDLFGVGLLVGGLAGFLFSSLLVVRGHADVRVQLEGYREAYENVYVELSTVREQLKLTEKLLKKINEKI